MQQDVLGWLVAASATPVLRGNLIHVPCDGCEQPQTLPVAFLRPAVPLYPVTQPKASITCTASQQRGFSPSILPGRCSISAMPQLCSALSCSWAE